MMAELTGTPEQVAHWLEHRAPAACRPEGRPRQLAATPPPPWHIWVQARTPDGTIITEWCAAVLTNVDQTAHITFGPEAP